MSDVEYPELQVVQASAPCPILARLPRLPVRVLILVQNGSVEEGRRPLVQRLERLGDELGVGEGIQVREHTFSSWPELPDEVPPGRFDVVFIQPSSVPGDLDDPEQPRPDVVDGAARVLGNAETRCVIVGPLRSTDGSHLDRRAALLLALIERGAPPAVWMPGDWSRDEVAAFQTVLFERLLHDAPLRWAAAAGAVDLEPLPVIYQPPGRRHGLDLGRLLEDHRRRIEEGAAALRSLEREVEAARPVPDDLLLERWTAIDDDVGMRGPLLDRIKAAVEEINRDRDPAGWSRLARSMAELRAWEDGLQRERARLEAYREAAFDASMGG